MARTGRVHSCQSLGTLDGPGVRFVVFLQGCPLRCHYCHNPDTWDVTGGEETDTQTLFHKILRCRPYFGEQGGVTVSGGEPLLQPEFVTELFTLCKNAGLHTALDTSGCLQNGRVSDLLDVCDLVLLDVKMTTQEDYFRYTGGSLAATMAFLEQLDERGIAIWIRQVIVRGLNDDEQSVRRLARLLKPFSTIEKIELLPFKKLCLEKYEQLGVAFPLKDTPETEPSEIEALQKLLPHL